MHVCLGGPTFKIRVDGRVFLFEDHPYCGPMPVKWNGGERTLSGRHRFWHAVTQWYANEKRVGRDGFAEWHEPPDPRAGMVEVTPGQWMPPEMAARLVLPSEDAPSAPREPPADGLRRP